MSQGDKDARSKVKEKREKQRETQIQGTSEDAEARTVESCRKRSRL